MRYGVQLFSLRKYLKDERGYENVFDRVKKAGAEVVQLSGGKPVPAEFLKGLTEKYSLPICLTHDSFARLENDLDGLVEEHRVYGCNAMGIGMMPQKFRTGKLSDLNRFADFLNDTAEKLAAKSMTIAYHNHWFEFASSPTLIGSVLRGRTSRRISKSWTAGWKRYTSRITNIRYSVRSGRGRSIFPPS